MPAILFRPFFDFDTPLWVPALREGLKGMDLRIAPEETGDPAEIEYLILWRLAEGDRERWPNLKAILSLSTGVNQYIGHPHMPEGVKLIRMIEPGLDHGMAEYVSSFVLRFHRNHDALAAAQARKYWDGDLLPPLASHRRVGFLGMGRMAQACIDALRPFGFAMRGWSRTPKDIAGVKSFHGADGLAQFLAGTDILVCLLPLTPETDGILNARTLGMLPRGACVINAARGKHVVDEDLLALLDSGHLDRAALDVFRKEPLPPDHPFWTHPRVHVTPHIAAVTMPDTGAASIRQAIGQIERGETPEGAVDISRGY